MSRSKDDMVLDLPKYSLFRKVLANRPMESPLKYPSKAPKPSVKRPAIGPGFSQLQYPEKRDGSGPKRVQEPMDR